MPDGTTKFDPETGEVYEQKPNGATNGRQPMRVDTDAAMDDPMPEEIANAILQVMEGAKKVEKGGHNAFHNYDYATTADMMVLIQPLMVKAGLIVTQHFVGATQDEGGNMVCKFRFRLTHKSGKHWNYPGFWLGVSQDRTQRGGLQDKWFSKAATAAEKYFLLKLFKIPTVDDAQKLSDGDADADQMQDRRPNNPAQERRQPPRRQSNGVGAQREGVSDEAHAEATRLYKEIYRALSNAKSEEEVGKILVDRSADLNKIKAVSQEGYDKLVAKADDRVSSFAMAG